MKTCEYCERPHYAKGMCSAHYQRKRKHGRLHVQTPGLARKKTKKLKRRIKDKIQKENNGCWNWTGATDKNGYGVIIVKGKQRKAHRVVYRKWNGKFKGKVYHTCNNRRCCNPEHLYVTK